MLGTHCTNAKYTLFKCISTQNKMQRTHSTKCSVHRVLNTEYVLYQMVCTHSTKFSVHTVQNTQYTQYEMLSTHCTKC